jgi:lipopolysaccharide/colanic/teichoic acid biosynthesis glycosyltransferase
MAAGVPFLNVQHPQFGGLVLLLQAITDRLVGLVALTVVSPLLLVTALAVRFTSPGGALFRQERIGRGGRPFMMYKFRSMHVDAEAKRDEVLDQNKHGGGPLFKAVADPRITPVGKFLRRFSLDELPQLWNVVKGDMALVGPRPPLPVEVAEYDSATLRRLLVRPGLTGLWQVSGRSDLPWEESVRLDLYYVDNRTVRADLAIIGRTGSAVIAGRGAY